MMRLIAALLAVSLLACGGDSSATAPAPPLSPISRLVLEDTSALVFTGSSVPGQAFVAHAYDATGAEVADPVLTLAAGSGWTVRGDTLIAPATEGRTTLRITATRAEPTTADWVHLSGVGPDSAVTANMDITAGLDLRASRWTLSIVCRFPYPYNIGHSDDAGVTIDSTRITDATVDSVLYASEVAAPDSGQDSPTWRWFRQNGALADVYYSGTNILWRVDGKADTVQFHSHGLNVAAEGADTLYWGTQRTPAPLVHSSPRRYVATGGYVSNWYCSGDPTGSADSLWFEETP